MPVKGFIFGAKRLKRHDVFGHAVDLDVVAVNDAGQIVKLILGGKHRRFPGVAGFLFAVGHGAVNPEFFLVHFGAVSDAGRLSQAGTQRAGSGFNSRQFLPFRMALKPAAEFS